MNRSDVTGNLDNRVVTILDEVETATDLQVQFQTLNESYVVAQYRFDPHSNTATLFLRSDWEDVDVAHELMHMKLEIVEGFAVLAWRSKVSRTNAIEAAFGRIRGYVDDEVVHSRLVQKGFTLDGEVLKSQIFEDIYTKVPRYLQKLRPRPDDGMAHLDGSGYGELCRSSFLVQAELICKNYSGALSDAHRKKAQRFISAFRTHRSPEARKADEVLRLFEGNNAMTVAGHKEILESWARLEALDGFVGPSIYTRQGNRYILPWP
jgi:hypothetical protein